MCFLSVVYLPYLWLWLSSPFFWFWISTFCSFSLRNTPRTGTTGIASSVSFLAVKAGMGDSLHFQALLKREAPNSATCKLCVRCYFLLRINIFFSAVGKISFLELTEKITQSQPCTNKSTQGGVVHCIAPPFGTLTDQAYLVLIHCTILFLHHQTHTNTPLRQTMSHLLLSRIVFRVYLDVRCSL